MALKINIMLMIFVGLSTVVVYEATAPTTTMTTGGCLDVTSSPGTSKFITMIFKKYGNQSTSVVISKEKLQEMMKELHIGNKMSVLRIAKFQMDDDVQMQLLRNIVNLTVAQSSKCYNVDNILQLHKIDGTKGITKQDFTKICPALVQQVISGNCYNHNEHAHEEPPTKTETWGYGFVSITIISFMSLALIVVIPFIKKSWYARVMSYLVALAVGTLSGDALLHLIPHAFGEGTNSAIGLIVSEEQEQQQEYAQVWRALMVLFGIYSFFAVELLMKMRGGGHGHSHGPKSKTPEGTPNQQKLRAPSTKSRAASTKSVTYDNSAMETDVELPTYQSGNEVIIYQSARKQSMRDPGEKAITGDTHVATVAWVVIIGDGFHNFSDGLAIGAAFSASLSSGLSTSIAVFCHELPHELGDFAILLQSGMTMKQALVYNIVSTILAYVGLTVGILAGGNEMGRHFILSITAGLFLYVSLADLLPELTNEDIPNTSKFAVFVIQHLGIITGIGIMLIISIYEHVMLG